MAGGLRTEWYEETVKAETVKALQINGNSKRTQGVPRPGRPDADSAFYLAVRSIVFKLAKGDAPDIAQMNARIRQMISDALASGAWRKFLKWVRKAEGKSVFLIQIIWPALKKIKLLRQLLAKAISDFKKVNKAKGRDFSEKFEALV